jgi:hypothetical protein
LIVVILIFDRRLVITRPTTRHRPQVLAKHAELIVVISIFDRRLVITRPPPRHPRQVPEYTRIPRADC